MMVAVVTMNVMLAFYRRLIQLSLATLHLAEREPDVAHEEGATEKHASIPTMKPTPRRVRWISLFIAALSFQCLDSDMAGCAKLVVHDFALATGYPLNTIYLSGVDLTDLKSDRCLEWWADLGQSLIVLLIAILQTPGYIVLVVLSVEWVGRFFLIKGWHLEIVRDEKSLAERVMNGNALHDAKREKELEERNWRP